MTHPARPTGLPGNPAGPLLLTLLGAAAMAALTLASGHGLLLAFLAYSLSGAIFLVAAAAGRIAIEAATARLAPAPRPARPHGLSRPAQRSPVASSSPFRFAS